MIGERTIVYNCKENDNTVKINLCDDKLEEILVGCRFVPSDGWSVIGGKDLTEVLRLIMDAEKNHG